ncbi:MAG: hypothetical protein F4X91_14160 [Nitrospinae bacterium]|nr:hypothetical protein [Nitrospinota bacterium]
MRRFILGWKVLGTPVLATLFQEVAAPNRLQLFDLVEVLDWTAAAKTSPEVFPRLRATFEALRDEGGNWYEESGEGAEFSIIRKRLTILGQKPA